MVTLRKRINQGGVSHINASNNFDGTGSSNRLAIPSRSSAFPLSNPAINRQLQYLPPPPGSSPNYSYNENDCANNLNTSPQYQGSSSAESYDQPEEQFPGTTKSTLRRNSKFAGPTFSELMRRSAPVYKDFKSSLRDTKAFYTSTPTVLTNANQDPEYANVRRSICVAHQTRLEQPDATDGFYPKGTHGLEEKMKQVHTSHVDSNMHYEDDDEQMVQKIVQHKPFS